jgi:hypothetical protein
MKKAFILFCLFFSTSIVWGSSITRNPNDLTGQVIITGDLDVSGAIAGATLDTGQGANELYDMDQNVLTTSLPTFDTVNATYGIGASTGVFDECFASTFTARSPLLIQGTEISFSTDTNKSGNSALVIKSGSGYVGILDLTPNYPLDVTGAGRVTGNFFTGGNSYVTGSVVVTNNNAFYGQEVGESLVSLIKVDTSDKIVIGEDSNSVQIDVTPVENALYVSSTNGYVGIWNNDPTSHFHIEASSSGAGSRLLSSIYNTGSGHSQLLLRTTSTGDPYMTFNAIAKQNWSIGIDRTDGDFKFGTPPAVTNGIETSVKVTFEPSGEVGIGTEDPTEKLEVNGNILNQGNALFAYDETGYTAIEVSSSITVATKYIILESSGGAVTLTSNPQIVDGTAGVITEVTFIGNSDTNTVTFVDGNGLQLAGGVSFTFGDGDTLTAIYYPTKDLWHEISRSDN